MLRANLVSLGIMVMHFAWIVHKLVSSNNPTRNASLSYCTLDLQICHKALVNLLNLPLECQSSDDKFCTLLILTYFMECCCQGSILSLLITATLNFWLNHLHSWYRFLLHLFVVTNVLEIPECLSGYGTPQYPPKLASLWGLKVWAMFDSYTEVFHDSSSTVSNVT